jgi:glycolate oxidase iron-sulfur subunit
MTPTATASRAEALSAALAAHDDRLSNCVHCGFCLPACPTYTRLGDEADSPRGRLHLMRAVAEGRLDPGSDAFQRHIDCCLGCRACETVCPSGVEYGFLLERAREVADRARPSRGAPALLLAMIRSAPVFTVSMWGARLLRGTGLAVLAAKWLPSWGGFHQFRLGAAMLAASAPWRVPSTPGRSASVAFGGAAAVRSERGMAQGEPVPRRGKVAVLLGCIQDQLFRRVNEATVRVLEANGWEVVGALGQGCCGALHAHAGRLSEARDMARRNIEAFRASGVDFIVANAAGCGAAMKEYAHLMNGEGGPPGSGDAHWFSERVRDISEVLASGGKPPVSGAPLPLRVAYDPPCHLLHGQRVGEPPKIVLRAIPGLELSGVPKGEECCGGAGVYGITHPELGQQIGGDKVSAVLETGASVVATGTRKSEGPGLGPDRGALRLGPSDPGGSPCPTDRVDRLRRGAGGARVSDLGLGSAETGPQEACR